MHAVIVLLTSEKITHKVGCRDDTVPTIVAIRRRGGEHATIFRGPKKSGVVARSPLYLAVHSCISTVFGTVSSLHPT